MDFVNDENQEYGEQPPKHVDHGDREDYDYHTYDNGVHSTVDGAEGLPPPSFFGSRSRGFPTAQFRGGGAGAGRGLPAGRGGPTSGGYFNGGSYGGSDLSFTPAGADQGPEGNDMESRLKRLAGCREDMDLWVETEADGGKKYYYQAITRETAWEIPPNSKVISQNELAELIIRAKEEEKQAEISQSAPVVAQNTPAVPQFGLPFGANIDEAWNEYSAPDGRKYYYNSITRENTWDKPKSILEKERAASAEASRLASLPPAVAEAQAKAQAALAAYLEQQRRGQDPSTAGLPTTTTTGASSTIKKEATSSHAQPKDSGRPVSSTPVPGTPWCVVWTGDGKVFFYNPSTKTSVWERPPEMYNRPDVDALVTKPPVSTKEEVESDYDGNDNSATLSGDSDDDHGPPKKKSRSERKREALLAQQKKDKEKPRQMLEKPLDPAVQAELDAQKEREKLPLEERLKQFKEMLSEKGVSTGSTFEKELSKIVFDSRYLLLGATERRACFDAFIREKLELDRAEKKKKAKEAKEKFTELLKEAGLHGKSSFSSFASKFGKDGRFKAVEKIRDKEDIFNDFVGELHKKEKEERRERKEKAKKDFVSLLEEQNGLTRKSKWSQVKKTLEDDGRYKAVDSSSTREQLFRDHIEKLGDESLSDIEEEQERQKRLAAEQAIAARTREVEAELGDKMRERDKESEKHRMQEHEERFKALMIDLVKQPDMSWHEARRVLRNDDRYSECDLLDKEKKESLFNDHARVLEKKRRDAFFAVLDEHPKITTQMRWKEARRVIQEEEDTFSKLASNSERKVERDFRDWQDERHAQIVKDFKEMLRETKIITYKSKKLVEENEQHLKDILAILENDKRWVRMSEHQSSERDRILDEYIDVLHRKGTPPPPTQQERERRRKD